MRNSYDAVVVGAGPAGSAAALTIAQGGMSVALLERGDYPGAKNVFGGTVYRAGTEDVFPAFWEEAPIERTVVTDQLWFLGPDSAVVMGFTGMRFARAPYNKFTILRAKFDRWMAAKAAAAGAYVITRALVKELIFDKSLLKARRVTGVRLASGETISADVVVIAEGANAMLAKQAGLRPDIPPHAVTLYAKEVLSLSAGKIEERFNLGRGEGATYGFIGYPTAGTIGKAGIWTNQDTISLVVGSYMNQMITRGLNPYQLLLRTKAHPLVKRLLEGAKPVEYQSHLIPKGGYDFLPTLFDEGLLVAGDAAVMVSGRHGTDLAILSGKYAGETVVKARARGDYSAKTLSSYERRLRGTFFMKDIRSGKDNQDYYKTHQDADFLVSNTMNDLGYVYFTEDAKSSVDKTKDLKNIILSQQNPLKSVADLYEGMQHWGVL